MNEIEIELYSDSMSSSDSPCTNAKIVSDTDFLCQHFTDTNTGNYWSTDTWILITLW